ELFDLGVLGRVPIPQTKRYRYLLGSRQVAAMLGSEEDIYHALAEIEEKDPTVAYDRSIHRRRYAPANLQGLNQNDWPYAPLTDLQIERIVDASPETAPVQIVCGLELLGLSKVGQSLKRISETGRLPGAPNEQIPVHIANSTRDLRTQIDRAHPGSRQLSLVVYQPENAKEAADVISWLEHQPRVLGSQVRPLIILDAADAEMRGLANRRAEQSQFLSAWGAEMVRAHLHQIEKTELDTPSLREIILEVAGGIPTETVKLIKEMRVAPDPMEIAQTWQPVLRPPPGILQGALGRALRILELADGGDYETLDDLMREDTGCELVDIGPDLRATGLVTSWNPKTGHIRRSALGDFIRKLIEK
ncbi:hypothetical protein ACFHWW_33710, partial [Ensifer sp. P24N7]|uniref:hypothetical protein n=1 Tax=Sinorhizobium sp. P24N7 TaxID=3348358 RepID=UPI0035F2F4A4